LNWSIWSNWARKPFTNSRDRPEDRRSHSALENDVSALVTKVELTYAVAAKLAHREPTMQGTVAIWSKVVAICAAIRRPRSFELCIARIQRKLPWIGSSISETRPSGGAPYMNDFASANR
jgi:hypothetical protein